MANGWNYTGWNIMVAGIQQSHWRQELAQQGVSMAALDLLRFGAGTLQSRGSEAAHATATEMADGFDAELGVGFVKAYANCIVDQKPEHRVLLNSLFQFCFSSGEYYQCI